MSGNKMEGELEPSSEVKMHIDVYKNKPGVNSVVHAHPPYATGFAVAGIPLDQCVIPEIIVSLGSIPLAKFGTPSTMEIPEKVRPYLKEHCVFLLENHGALSVGDDVFQAYYRMESLELFAKISLIAKQVGNVNVLSEENVKKILRVREDFGLSSQDYPGCRVDGKFVRSYDSDRSQASGAPKNSTSGSGDSGTGSDGKIEITPEKLTEIITTVVNNVVRNMK
jgi:L-fuculose-phosphate aldolase